MPSIQPTHVALLSDADMPHSHHAQAGHSHATSIRTLVQRGASAFILWRRRAAESAELSSTSNRELLDFGTNHYEVTTKLD